MAAKLDHEALAQDLVRAIRGKRSQVALSRRLGYTSNVVYTWESGRRWPTAATFLQAAARTGIDVDAPLRRFVGGAWPDGVTVTSPAGVTALLVAMRGSRPLVEIAERAGRSRFAMSRWLKGTAEPRLPEFLLLVDAMTLRALDLVAELVDPATLPSARLAWRRLERARALAWSAPWAQAVLLALELADYRALPAHDDAWLAARLGLSEEAVRQALELLLDSGQATWRGGHAVPVAVQAVDVRRPRSGTLLKEHWAQVALERLSSGAPTVWSYNVFAVSEADLERIEAMQRAHYRAVRSLVAASEPAERVVLLQLQLVPLDHPVDTSTPGDG